MKKRLFTGVLFIVLGILEAVGPHTFIPVCDAMDGKFMKCYWTAQAETGIGISIVVLGVLLILLSSRQIRIGISIGIALNAILVILIPDALIGVCGKIHMSCRALTLPALNLLGALTLLAAVINVWLLRNENREVQSKT